MKIYIVYKLTKLSNIYKNNNLTAKNALFGAVSLTKNADVDKYKYSGYGIAFDRKGSFSFPGGEYGQNVTIFGADMNSSPHIDNKGKDILILGTGPLQRLGEHSLTVEKMYLINFTKDNTKLIWKKVALLVIFMILVLVMMLLVSMILKTFISI